MTKFHFENVSHVLTRRSFVYDIVHVYSNETVQRRLHYAAAVAVAERYNQVVPKRGVVGSTPGEVDFFFFSWQQTKYFFFVLDVYSFIYFKRRNRETSLCEFSITCP